MGDLPGLRHRTRPLRAAPGLDDPRRRRCGSLDVAFGPARCAANGADAEGDPRRRRRAVRHQRVMLTYEDVSIGDQLWCLAWIGKEFTVVEKDDETRRVALEGPSAVDPYGAQVDLFPDTMWMATRE